jgi:hypothetical protein
MIYREVPVEVNRRVSASESTLEVSVEAVEAPYTVPDLTPKMKTMKMI